MKKLSVLFIIVAIFFVVGCASDGPSGDQVQIDQESKELTAKILGRRIGAELQKQCPDVAAEVHTLCQEITTSKELDIADIAIKRMLNLLADETGDPLLAADISDLLDLLQIKLDVEIPSEQVAIVVAAAKGLLSGIEIIKGLEVKDEN